MNSPQNRSDPRPPVARPTLLWDGDCSFCRRWIARWRKLTGDAIDYQPYQAAAAERAPGVPREAFGKAVHLVEPDGRITRAAEAVFRSLALGGRMRWLLWLHAHVPPFRWATELGYAIVASNRNAFDKVEMTISRAMSRGRLRGHSRRRDST